MQLDIVGLRPGLATSHASIWQGDRQVEAARLMQRSLRIIKELRQSKGLPIDRSVDPNETGIIGEEFTPLTTSLGDAEAKRTSANPAFAALLVHYFVDSGLKRGDVVAVGASGSFPALLLATLCAARVLDLEPIVIYSIGASMYGTNLPGFTFVDMLAGLRADDLLPYRLAAVSPGGQQDRGSGVVSVLVVGGLVAAVLRLMGLSDQRAAAFVFMLGILSAVAPPINVWAMLMAAGANMPYVGFDLVLLVPVVVVTVITVIYLGWGAVPQSKEAILDGLPPLPAGTTW